MDPREHLEAIRRLAEADSRYAPEAFFFVSEAVGQTAQWIQDKVLPEENAGPRSEDGADRFHVSGQELLAGIRKLARDRWGMLAPRVLGRWGVRRTEDFGEIVFLMVGDEALAWKSRECDRREDFANGFDFRTAFEGVD